MEHARRRCRFVPLSGYDLKTGKEVWWIRRLPWQIKPTPVIADGIVYFVTNSGESNPGEQEVVPPFPEALAKFDANKDGKLGQRGDRRCRRSKRASMNTWIWMTPVFSKSMTGSSFKSAAWVRMRCALTNWEEKGDITDTHAFVEEFAVAAECAFAARIQGRALHREGGRHLRVVRHQDRRDSQAGAIGGSARRLLRVTHRCGWDESIRSAKKARPVVIEPGADWKVIRVNDLKDGCKATFAPAGDKMYVRTYGMLYCFARKD